jgi:hypothetical protein
MNISQVQSQSQSQGECESSQVHTITQDRHTITQGLLVKDRERATDVLLQLRYQLSRTVSSIEVK